MWFCSVSTRKAIKMSARECHRRSEPIRRQSQLRLMKDFLNLVFVLVDHPAAAGANDKLLQAFARKLAGGFGKKKGKSDKGRNVEALFCNRTNK